MDLNAYKYNTDETFKYKIQLANDAQPEERRMSDLSDWAPSISSSTDIQVTESSKGKSWSLGPVWFCVKSKILKNIFTSLMLKLVHYFFFKIFLNIVFVCLCLFRTLNKQKNYMIWVKYISLLLFYPGKNYI